MLKRVLLVALVVSPAAPAQTFEGLDLTEDDKKDEKKQDEKKPAEQPQELELDLTEPTSGDPAAPAKPADRPARKKPTPEDTGPAVERDVTQDDRVKAVQRKLYLKKNRFELAPAVVINVNDAFYTRWGGSIRGAFFPADTLAIAARFSLLQTIPTDDVRIAKRNLSSQIFFSVPVWTLTGDVEWSPLYGKVAIFNSILQFDGYLLAGAGVVFSETSASNDVTRAGIRPAFDLGVGMRFVTRDWLAVNVSLINTTYIDLATGSPRASVQNLMVVQAGLSIFFPFKSTFREAE